MKPEIVATTYERLKQAFSQSNLKQSDLVRITGIDKSSISLYLSGKVTPKGDKLYKLALALNVSPVWLSGFNVPMSDNIRNSNISPELSLTPHEISVITAYRDQPEMQPAVDKLLGVNTNEDTVVLLRAARSANNRPVGTIRISKKKLEQLRNAPSVDKEEDI